MGTTASIYGAPNAELVRAFLIRESMDFKRPDKDTFVNVRMAQIDGLLAAIDTYSDTGDLVLMSLGNSGIDLRNLTIRGVTGKRININLCTCGRDDCTGIISESPVVPLSALTDSELDEEEDEEPYEDEEEE